MKAVDALAKKKLSKAPVLGLDHIGRVERNAEAIATGLGHDSTVLEAAVKLHSIGAGQWLQYRQDYVQTSVAFAKGLLERNSVKREISENVLHCIAEHGVLGKPRTTEARILHDAFALEMCGALGFAHVCYSAGHEKKSPKELLSALKQHTGALEGAFTTEKGRELSAGRLQKLKEMVSAFENDFINITFG